MESMLNKLVAVNGKFKEHIAVVDVGGCFAEACMQYTEHVKLLRLEYPEKAATTVESRARIRTQRTPSVELWLCGAVVFGFGGGGNEDPDMLSNGECSRSTTKKTKR